MTGEILTAAQVRARLERTRDLDDRATLIRAAAALQRAGAWDGSKIPPLRPDDDDPPRAWHFQGRQS